MTQIAGWFKYNSIFYKTNWTFINFILYRWPRNGVFDMNIRNEERNPEGFNEELDSVCSLADK